jgi:carboxylesterase
MPHHGFRDVLGPYTSQIRAYELLPFVERAVDLMHGLGEEIIVCGLSMGGTMSTWVAQTRADVSIVIIVSAALGYKVLPTRLTRIAGLLMRILPNNEQWWNAEKKEDRDAPFYSYQKRSTHSLAQILKLGFKAGDLALRKAPAARKVWMFINDHDEAVNREMLERLVRRWRKTGAKNVEEFHLPDELGIPHNCITEGVKGGNTELVYGEILRMIG